MPTIETKDGIFLDIPEGMAPDAPEVKEAVQAERVGRRKRRMDSPEFKAKVEAQQAEDRETYDPTKGMSGWEKTKANVGAGADSLVQGLKQVLPGMKGPSDADLIEKRQRDATLAKGTDLGVGADWMPTAGSALQFVGENAPLVVPGGVAGRLGAKALPRALSSTAGRRAVTEGAVAGGGMGAVMPTTSDESRGLNMMVGAGLGGALPLAIRGGKAVKDYFTGAGARRGAAGKLGVTPDTPLPPDPAAMSVPGAEKVPLTTAATYSDPALAAQELAARARQGPGWAEFDAGQRRAVWEGVEEGTQRAGTEATARMDRQALWKTREAEALKALKPKVWEREMVQLRANLEQAMRSPEGMNEMRPVLKEIIGQMDEAGKKGFTPQHLARLRSRMAGRVRGSPTDPFTSAPMSDPAFISLRQEMDNILNNATGNKWGKVIEGYREASIPVGQAKAESVVKNRFVTPEGTPRTTAAEPGVPTVTENALRKAITAPEMKNVRGTAPTFAPDSEHALKGTLAALERQNILSRAKGTATGGGGSMTQPLATMMRAKDPSGGIISAAVELARRAGDRRALAELDQALIDPQRYRSLVEETIKAGKPLSPGMRLAMQAAQTASTGGGLEAIEPQPMEMR